MGCDGETGGVEGSQKWEGGRTGGALPAHPNTEVDGRIIKLPPVRLCPWKE